MNFDFPLYAYSYSGKSVAEMWPKETKDMNSKWFINKSSSSYQRYWVFIITLLILFFSLKDLEAVSI
jgi:hypothetical protein